VPKNEPGVFDNTRSPVILNLRRDVVATGSRAS
jgi:hypothetical protein